MSASKGRFVWYDLMTNDVAGATAFYTETVGWKTRAWEGGDKPYTMFCVGEQPIGGVAVLPPEAAQMGAPPHWMAYVATDDVEGTAKEAEKLGGKILKAPWDLLTVGRVAVLADPQGAVFAAFKAAQEMPMHEGKPRAGDMSWHELNTTDYESAWKFYGKLFGWKHTGTHDMGPEMGGYFMFQRGDGPEGSMGGMANAAERMKASPHWLYYIRVDDVDGAVGRIKAKGGKVLNGPMEVPGGDRVAQCMDPQGVAFAIHGPKA